LRMMARASHAALGWVRVRVRVGARVRARVRVRVRARVRVRVKVGVRVRVRVRARARLEVRGPNEAQHRQAGQRASRQGRDQGLRVSDPTVLLQVEHLQLGQRAW